MKYSAYPKTQAVIRNVGSAQRTNGAGEVRIPLNRDTLTTEQQVNISVALAGTVALGAQPTDLMMHVAKLVDTISIETDKGSIIVGDGQSIALLAALTENQATPKFDDVAGTASFTIDLHHENDGALYDMATAVETGNLSKNDLVIRFADPVAVGVFAAGGAVGVATFDVRVNAVQYPAIKNAGSYPTYLDIDETTGEQVELVNPHFGIASMSHRVRTQTLQPNGAGRTNFILMAAGSALRFAGLVAIDTATGLPIDGALGQVSLTVGGNEVRSLNFDEIKSFNESKRGVVNTGSAFIDFGDDEQGFLDLTNVAEARLFVEVLAAAPANLELRLVEDYTAES